MSDDARRWDRRWSEVREPLGPAHPLVRRLVDQLPPGAAVLDVAAGRGRQARAFASAGMVVTAVDVSVVGLAQIHRVAPTVRTLQADLTDGLPAVLRGPFDAVVCVDYRDPSLWTGLRACLAPGGHLLVSMASMRNLERHPRPSRRFLAPPDDLEALLDGLCPVVASVDWRPNGRCEQWVWARRRPD